MAASIKSMLLRDVVRFANGKSIKPGGEGCYPAYGSNGLIGASTEFLHENGIIIGRVGAYCGSVEYCPDKFWASDNTLVAFPASEQVDTKFLFYLLTDAKLSRYAGGAAQPLVTQTVLKQVKVGMPPLPVQRRIARILSAYDELIANGQRRRRTLETIARALYREWFVEFRFPGHDKIPLVSSRLGETPPGWEVVSIDDVCARVTDGSHHSPPSADEGLPMASSKDMHDWGLDLETCRRISGKDFADLARNDCKPKRNDVLITKDGANYLKRIFVTRTEQEVVLLSSIAILRPNEKINPHLLAAILSDPENKNRLKNYVTGAAIPRVILKDFKRFEILLPSHEVQNNWAKLAVPITEMIWRLIDQTVNLRRTRDLLLPRLLSGQVALTDNAA